METMTLRNGKSAPANLVAVWADRYQRLYRQNRPAFFELVDFARRPAVRASSPFLGILNETGYVDAAGRLAENERTILLAMIDGALPGYEPVSPLPAGQELEKGSSVRLCKTVDSWLFRRMSEAASIILDFAKARRQWLQLVDMHVSFPDHTVHQTASGLFLVTDDLDAPIAFWSPWGRWKFADNIGGPWTEAFDQIINLFQATLYRRGVGGEMVYGIRKVGEHELVEPMELLSGVYDNPASLREDWNRSSSNR